MKISEPIESSEEELDAVLHAIDACLKTADGPDANKLGYTREQLLQMRAAYVAQVFGTAMHAERVTKGKQDEDL
jgi:hypothetical protein